MCLFNPQIDIHTLLKHNRETFPVLTSPLTLHLYHRNGFPWIIAFKDGKRIFSDGMSPYEDTFRTLMAKLWPDTQITISPVSPMHMADYFTFTNESNYGVLVFPDEDEEMFHKLQKKFQDSKALEVKYESQLTTQDLKKNLFFQENTGRFRFEFLKGKKTPITITDDQIRIGIYEFPRSEVGLRTSFPNPLNEERYVMFVLRGSKLKSGMHENFVDYLIYREGEDGKAEMLLHGLFDKSEKNWAYSSHLSFGSDILKVYCKNGVCPAAEDPQGASFTGIPAEFSSEKREKNQPEITRTGNLWTIGDVECRFPSIVVDGKGTCWVAWEDKGDILLASLNAKDTPSNERNNKPSRENAQPSAAGDPLVKRVEDGPSDSFHPVLGMEREKVWIFYLNDEDGLYRVYGKSLSAGRLSDAILISEKQPCDAITPAVACSKSGTITVAWTDWKANSRYPKYRTLEGRFLGEIQPIHIKRSEKDYTNAWCASIACDNTGKVWGAWNQHYPLVLGVYAGDLVHEAQGVSEHDGGYPSVTFDGHNILWVFWETSMWDARKGKTQKILASYYDAKRDKWALPYTISHADQTRFNQTPKAASAPDGTIWVAWSGRKNTAQPWLVYVSHLENDSWVQPKSISADNEYARAPAISAGRNGVIWVAWHSGKGSKMKIKAMRIQRP